MIINQCVKLFIWVAKVIINDLDTSKTLASMYRSTVTKIKDLLAKYRLSKKLWNMALRFASVSIDRNNSIEKCK